MLSQKMSSPSFYLFNSNSAFLRASSASCLVPIMTHATQLTKHTAFSPIVKSSAVILSYTSSGVLFLVKNILPFFNMMVSMVKKTIPDTIKQAQYTPQHLANGFIRMIHCFKESSLFSEFVKLGRILFPLIFLR